MPSHAPNKNILNEAKNQRFLQEKIDELWDMVEGERKFNETPEEYEAKILAAEKELGITKPVQFTFGTTIFAKVKKEEKKVEVEKKQKILEEENKKEKLEQEIKIEKEKEIEQEQELLPIVVEKRKFSQFPKKIIKSKPFKRSIKEIRGKNKLH